MSDNEVFVRKEPEFKEFLKMVGEEKIPDTWELVAEAIGVHPHTIINWRKTPEFQEALARGIQNAMVRMEKAGNSDWRMWREKIALLRKEKDREFNINQQFNVGGEMTLEFTVDDK